MRIQDLLPQLRREHNLTQADLAAKLYVTRQAVSRWETGETTPGIDMVKLLAVTLDVPVTQLIDMPEPHCESCGMILQDPTEYGTKADGSAEPTFCRWCYEGGSYIGPQTMDDVIEDWAPRLADYCGWSVDDSVSLLGAVLPTLKRWRESTDEPVG